MIAVCLFGCVLAQAIKNPCCGTCTYKIESCLLGIYALMLVYWNIWNGFPRLAEVNVYRKPNPSYIMYIVGKRTWSMVFPTWTALLQGSLGHLQKNIVFSSWFVTDFPWYPAWSPGRQPEDRKLGLLQASLQASRRMQILRADGSCEESRLRFLDWSTYGREREREIYIYNYIYIYVELDLMNIKI